MKAFLFLLAAPLTLAAAAPQQDPSLPYRMHTCESDIDQLQKRQETLESQIDSLQNKLTALSDAADSSKGVSQQKLALTDSSIERLSKELSSLRDYSKTMSDSVNTLQKRLTEVEQESKHNSAHAEKLEAALRSLTKLIQGQTTAASSSSAESSSSTSETGNSTTYKVKSGDSLGKIAKAHNTTVDTLVKLNDLKPDARILIGQELKLP